MCYPWSYRPALLRLFCADGISSAQRTLSVMSLPREDAREGGRTVRNPCAKGNCWKRRGSQRSRSLQGSLPHLVGSHSFGGPSRCSCHSANTGGGTTVADRAN